MVINSKSMIDTFNLGKDVAAKLSGGEVILLGGDLGAGKTVFAKGVAVGLGIKCDVLSPTFTIMNEYEGRLKLYHYDAYRLQSGEEAEAAGLTEYFGEPNSVCLIEWHTNIASALKRIKTTLITIKYIDENTREIEINDK